MSSVKERLFITREDKIEQYENNLVTLTLKSGEIFEDLEPRRLFPVSAASVYITLLDKDGCEVGIIRSIEDLSHDSRRAIEYSLNDYYLVPNIIRIISTSEKYGALHWVVETDRGIKEFDIRNRNHDIKVFSDGKVRIRDSDDNRYLILNYRNLDKHSRAKLIADM